MKQNKRGISDVVATVLVIMITVVAGAMIYVFVVPFVQNSLQKSSECLSYKGYYSFDDSFGYNCFDANGLYAISIAASSNKDIAGNVGGIKLVLNDKSGSNKVLEIRNGAGSLGIWMKGNENLTLPGSGGIATYVYNASSGDEFITAEAYPILKSGRICADLKELVTLKSCEKSIG